MFQQVELRIESKLLTYLSNLHNSLGTAG
jgi:hypothetical protein